MHYIYIRTIPLTILKLKILFLQEKITPIKRDVSLPRARNEPNPAGGSGGGHHAGPLRVALPDEPQNCKNSRTAHVKPFLSPNSKQQGHMGDVAAARGNWRPLTVGGGGSGGSTQSNSGSGSSTGSNPVNHRDFLSEQRRQMAEIERMRSMGATGGENTTAQNRNVLPPSGAGRPVNHLEVNKMAQVNCNWCIK